MTTFPGYLSKSSTSEPAQPPNPEEKRETLRELNRETAPEPGGGAIRWLDDQGVTVVTNKKGKRR